MRILVIEDDNEIAEMLVGLLEANGYIVDHQISIELAIEAIKGADYACVILDRGLPDGDGVDLIEQLKRELPSEELPSFLILSAHGQASDRIHGLSAGALDYLAKPYEPDELLLRLRICSNSKQSAQHKVINVANAQYDLNSRQLSVDGQAVALPRRELAIFDLLVRRKGEVVSHQAIENSIYSFDDEIASNTVSSQISRLRKTLANSGSGLHIRVMRHVGYILVEK